MNTIPTGWLCPKCNVVHAPSVLECRCSQAAGIPTRWPSQPLVPSTSVPLPSTTAPWVIGGTTSVTRGVNDPRMWLRN